MPHDAKANLEAILNSPSYRLAERDPDLLARPELRPVRLQLELFKPELALIEHKIVSTIVVFGSTQIIEEKDSQRRLDAARKAAAADPRNARLARLAARAE